MTLDDLDVYALRPQEFAQGLHMLKSGARLASFWYQIFEHVLPLCKLWYRKIICTRKHDGSSWNLLKFLVCAFIHTKPFWPYSARTV